MRKLRCVSAARRPEEPSSARRSTPPGLALSRCCPAAYVVTSATAHFLNLHSPAGFERFAAEVGEPAQALTLSPPPAGPPDFAALAQAGARHQITILAPPPQPGTGRGRNR